MNKSKILTLSFLGVLVLVGCQNNINTSDNSSEESSFVEPALEAIKESVLSTKYKGFTSFKESGDINVQGSAKFYTNALYLTGSAEYEEEGTESFVVYKILDGSIYYDIDTFSGRSAKKYSIVDTVNDSNKEILGSNALKGINEYKINKNWFIEDVNSIFSNQENLSYKINDNLTGYTFTSTGYVSGYKTYSLELSFTYDNELLKGHYELIDWGKDNFDIENKTPLDDSQKPSSKDVKEVELELGEIVDLTSKEISEVTDKYYVKSIDSVVIKGYNNDDNFIVPAGDYVKFELEAFSPSTALNFNEFKIVNSSDQDIISVSDIGSAKAVNKGKVTLTVSNLFGDVKKDFEVTVVAPELKSIWWGSTKDVTVALDETIQIPFTFYPEKSEDELTVNNSDSTVLEVIGFSDDRTSVEVKGLKVGTTKLVVSSVKNAAIKSKELTVKVEIPRVEGDTRFLIGVWENTQTKYSVEYITKVTFNKNHTGLIEQKVEGIVDPNEATFTWSYYDSVLEIADFKSEEKTLKNLKNLTVSEDKSTITFDLFCEDDEGMYQTLTIALTKAKVEIDVSWLIGTWEDDDNGITMAFKEDKTGTFKMGLYSKPFNFTWEYDGSTLSFPTWDSNSIVIKGIIEASKTKLKFSMEDYDEPFTAILVKY